MVSIQEFGDGVIPHQVGEFVSIQRDGSIVIPRDPQIETGQGTSEIIDLFREISIRGPGGRQGKRDREFAVRGGRSSDALILTSIRSPW